jgi:SAM-dependent methyltransferase
MDPPAEMAVFYPSDYYAFQTNARISNDRFPWRRRLLYFPITAARLGWPTWVGRTLHKIGSGPTIPNSLRMIVRPLRRNSPILDIGCATGRELFSMRSCGFESLLGVDPFLPKDIIKEKGIQILKLGVEEVQGSFDLIMLHHVFEHLQNPMEMLTRVKQLLSPSGQILIRIPLSDSKTALEYGEKWVQLDAPRHFFLHTRKSMEIAAEKSGLRIAKVQYDSEEFQFIGSELYLRTNMSLQEFYADYEANYKKHFQPNDEQKFRERAALLNIEQNGDQAGFCLLKQL